ncbi:hypothetical protein GOV07_05115 [Candidatus Woesearchaeota archaeon]|nr:hypothetical protein [Candidatus Woesearchaeota archaeon]
MKDILKGIWKDLFKRYLVLGLVILWIALLLLKPPAAAESGGELHFFFHPNCPHCEEQKPFMESLMAERDIEFVYHDTSNLAEVAVMREKAKELGIPESELGVPLTIIDEKHFLGYSEGIGIAIQESLEAFLRGEGVKGNGAFNSIVIVPFLGEIDVLSYSLPTLAIILGLVDGFNPCAMWVLVYLISIIITLNDKRKIWLLVGSFVLASGILYFLFMTAWLNAFLLLGYTRPLTLAIGLAALAFGILNLKSFVESKGPLVCEVTDAGSRKKTISRIDNIVKSPLTWGTVAGIIVLAFVVNSIEFACSAALPAIFTQVLALSGINTLQHYLYILLYVLFFMLDDFIIFGLAAFAVSSTFSEKYMKACKLVGGILLIVIGILLVFAPSLLQ